MIRKVYKKIKKIFYKEDLSIIRKGKKKDFIFIHINKTAGTSIIRAIEQPFKLHYTAKEIIEVIGSDKFNDSFKFCVVRNPWDKVVSHYLYRVKTNQTNMRDKKISFEEWVKLTYGEDKDYYYYDKPKMFQPQLEWLLDTSNNLNVDMCLRFENLNEDFTKLSEIIGVKGVLPHLNSTGKKDYKDFYDSETKEIVAKHFKRDIDYFNYSYE